MFVGHVLADAGYVNHDKVCETTNTRCSTTAMTAVKQRPYRGDIVRIASTKGDRDLVVTADQFVMVRSLSPRSWTWKRAKHIRRDDWIGVQIPTDLLIIRSSTDRETTALGHQRNSLFAGVARPVVDNRLGETLSPDDGVLDETHAWFRVTDVTRDHVVSFMLSAKHAVVENVQLLEFP